MRAKHSPALLIGATLGVGMLLTACGPIAFNDTVNFVGAQPEPEPEPPPRVHAKVTGDSIVLDDKIQFGYDSAEIQSQSLTLLDDLVKVLQDNPDIEQINIIGHTSTEGSTKHNKQLSTERAAAVAKYVADQGIDPSRITSEGKGESEPLVEESSDADKEKNRRVEIKIIKQGEGSESSARGRPGGGS
ncbi:OmpA family protein [Pseudenhygromyxa sp. WMMC2535]|uniref:OmpA family protein n=1 Tax=Pseudenhygromyxa sp. WMMC2535 TaxID=2712867 RepID=UPI0015545242|nr:OmpA family protein [Pseudenhygromyxa sp. WMMC2535]NVB38972.1 OmpA family protein [Pseudenhygromyxa sp. WMMC2535]